MGFSQELCFLEAKHKANVTFDTMRGADEAHATDVRELRRLLKSAQNDVKRYAAHVIRLQQELDRERLSHPPRHETATPEDLELVGEELRDVEIERAGNQAAHVQQSLEKLIRDAASDCDVCHNAAAKRSEATQQIQRVKQVVVTQRQQIEALARENAKLRDTVERRPTHRDVARSQWQIERLQAQIARLREQQSFSDTPVEVSVPVFDAPPQDTLTDRIGVDKLLSWLHVETKKVHQPEGSQAKRNRRRFLKEPVECYLVLDAAALDGPTASGSSTVSETEKMKKREQLSRRVGILCSEIVASCCHSVGVYEVAKLPRYVEATYQYAQLVPHLQAFVHRVDDLTHAAAVKMNGRSDAGYVPKPSEKSLDSLCSRVQDLVFEVRARREQMTPPGDEAFAVVLRCMKLLQAERIDQLGSTIEKLLDTTRSEREFVRDIRRVLGLDVAAPRATVLLIITKLMEQIGLSTSPQLSTQSRASFQGGLSSSQLRSRRS